MPNDWCEHVPMQDTQQSIAGGYFRVANGQTIYNHGEKRVSMMTKEGATRDMRFTVCDVSKALGSVSQMCRIGHRVVFNPPWSPEDSYIEHIDIDEIVWFEESNGLYVLNTKIAPIQRQSTSDRDTKRNSDFGWPAVP